MYEMNVNSVDTSVASRAAQAFQAEPADENRNGIYRLPVAEIGETEEEFELNRIVVLGYN